jgi:hypothetical protein
MPNGQLRQFRLADCISLVPQPDAVQQEDGALRERGLAAGANKHFCEQLRKNIELCFRERHHHRTNAFVLRLRQTNPCISWGVQSQGSDRKEVTMPAVAEVLSTVASNPNPRGCDLPACPVCGDSMVAAEASAYLSNNFISYLWTCDSCGHGFVTKHVLKPAAHN